MNAAILGCGLISGRWIRALSADPRVPIAALIDVDPDAAARVSKRCGLNGVPWFPDLETALAATDLRIVVNLTPGDVHAQYTRTALEYGLHVFTEKPLALQLGEARELVVLARSQGLVLGVMSNRAHDARFLAYRDIVHATGPGPYAASVDMFVRLDAPGFRSRLPFPATADLAVHAFDQIQQIIHAVPSSVTCTEVPLPFLGAHCSVASATVHFTDGSVFAFRGGFGGMGQRTSADGQWRIDVRESGCQWDGLGTVVTLHDVEPDRLSITRLPDTDSGHGPRICAMVDAVHGGPPQSDGLGSIAMLDAALRSADTGRPVDVPEVRL
ncbi:MAG: Gfo/Idh/MocA family protein [Actinomadura sp.]